MLEKCLGPDAVRCVGTHTNALEKKARRQYTHTNNTRTIQCKASASTKNLKVWT